MDEYTKNCLSDEPDLAKRIEVLSDKFDELYKHDPEIVIRSPGRIEVIGNHTDYNEGYALSACISKSMLALLRKNDQNKIRLFSTMFPDKVIEFPVSLNISKDEETNWTNYARGVVQGLKKAGISIGGADILIDSKIPGTGASSSAAYELAIAHGLLNLYEVSFDPMRIALLAQKAENQYVGSPCGFLDQGTITFGKKDSFVFLDFLPKGDKPVSEIELTRADMDVYDITFALVLDQDVKRELGTSGYPARRKKCESSLTFWEEKLGKSVPSLRHISVEEFEKHKRALSEKDDIMRKRVEHVVYENRRVLEARENLRKGNIGKVGNLLSDSGKSALELYNLDDQTPELTFLVDYGRELPGILGYRNMGGGFNATTLALIEKNKLKDFSTKITSAYEKEFGGNLQIIDFAITGGIGELKV